MIFINISDFYLQTVYVCFNKMKHQWSFAENMFVLFHPGHKEGDREGSSRIGDAYVIKINGNYTNGDVIKVKFYSLKNLVSFFGNKHIGHQFE